MRLKFIIHLAELIKEGFYMIETSNLTKQLLIENLWTTDEMLNEIEILKTELEKKQLLKENTLKELEEEYLKTVEEKHLSSLAVKRYTRYENLVQQFKDIRSIAILVDLIVCVLIAYALVFLGFGILKTAAITVFLPFIFYFIYHQIVKIVLKNKEPEYPLNLEIVIKKAKLEEEYFHLKDALVIQCIDQEMKQMNQREIYLKEKLEQQSVLTEIYWPYTRKVIWFLENLMADDLKEALKLLAEANHRDEIKKTVETQNRQIEDLNKRFDKLVEDQKKIVIELNKQREKIKKIS